MSRFSVVASDLTEASALLSGQEFAVFGTGGEGAAGTPVAGVWAGFVDNTDGVSRGSAHAVDGLSRALGLAGRAYELADDSAVRVLGGV